MMGKRQQNSSAFARIRCACPAASPPPTSELDPGHARTTASTPDHRRHDFFMARPPEVRTPPPGPDFHPELFFDGPEAR
eukprot:3360739-Pyramimonas_sp.AAC.1